MEFKNRLQSPTTECIQSNNAIIVTENVIKETWTAQSMFYQIRNKWPLSNKIWTDQFVVYKAKDKHM